MAQAHLRWLIHLNAPRHPGEHLLSHDVLQLCELRCRLNLDCCSRDPDRAAAAFKLLEIGAADGHNALRDLNVKRVLTLSINHGRPSAHHGSSESGADSSAKTKKAQYDGRIVPQHRWEILRSG